MKILILTQPLRTNYGGLLQAYALQKVLRDRGHEVETDNRPKYLLSPLRIYAGIGMRWAKKYLLRMKGVWVDPFKDYRYITRHSDRFIAQHIRTTDFLYSLPYGEGRKRLSKKYNVIVVGSDQVWRPKYSPATIQAYFLDFLEPNRPITIAYAASFGVDSLSEWTSRQIADCSALAKQFDAISVREDSGVKLCKDHFDVEACHLLDPTLLLNKEDYLKLIDPSDQEQQHILMTYILDSSKEKERAVNYFAQIYRLRPERVIQKQTLTFETLSDIENCVYPSVSKWLAGFRDADFVVTDSFHGTVFSIIFNKPFVVIANPERGETRMTSLLSIFKLENRLISETDDPSSFVSVPIDWEHVNTIRKEWQKRSFDFLDRSLAPSPL